MTIIRMPELVAEVTARGAGLGAFNVIHLETAEAIISAAEQTGLGVVLQISENCVGYHGGLEPIAAATLAAAAASTAGVCVHLDHAEDERLARRALDLGFGSVMYDGAHLDYESNVAATRRVVGHAHELGASVEAELGRIGGKDGAHAPGIRTDPGEAADFVAATGVDALAVAVGSSHAMSDRSARLDIELIGALRAAVPAAVPLVLHGSSGVPDDGIRSAIRAGMTKINVSTQLNRHFTAAIREHLRAHPDDVDSRRYIGAGRDAVTLEVARLLRVIDTAEAGADAAAPAVMRRTEEPT